MFKEGKPVTFPKANVSVVTVLVPWGEIGEFYSVGSGLFVFSFTVETRALLC